jgi:hypothetical protein
MRCNVNRYEEILTRMVVAYIAADYEPLIAAKSEKLRQAASILEAHFKDIERAEAQRSWADRSNAFNTGIAAECQLPALLRRQAE